MTLYKVRPDVFSARVVVKPESVLTQDGPVDAQPGQYVVTQADGDGVARVVNADEFRATYAQVGT